MTPRPSREHRAGPALAVGLGILGLFLFAGPAPAVLLAPFALGAAVGLLPPLATPLLVMTLPFYLHPISLSGLELSVTELAIAGSVLGVLIRATYDRMTHQPPSLHLVSSNADWIAAGFLAAGLLSLLPTEYPKQSLRELRWLIVEPILVFYLVRLTVHSDRGVLVTLWSLVGAGIVASLISLAELLSLGALFNLGVRPASPYLSANHLALFLERTAAIGLALALFTRATRPALAAAGVAALAVARTLSLGAWLGLGTATLVLLSLRSRRWAVGAAIGFFLILGLALAVLPPERGLDRLNPEHGTALFRIEIWTASLHMLADHPILGIGLDNFLYLYRSEYMLPEAWEEPNISHPHNWILNFWLSLGLPGLAAAVGGVSWLAAEAHRRFRHPASPSDRALGAAALGILLSFLVHGSLDNSYFLVDLAVVWWIVLGLLARPRSTDSQPEPDSIELAALSK